jgi:RimJ/RimL family protein N-acetyltransferase
MNRLSTKRLLIRPLELADSAAIFAYRSDPEVVRYQMWKPVDERDVHRFIRGMRGLTPGVPGIWYQFGIVELQSGNLIGDCGVHMPLDDPGSVEVGLTLCQNFQEQGYGTEALQALIRFCFHTLHMHRVVARTHPDNHRSISLIKCCEFTPLPLLTTKDELVFELRHISWEQSTGYMPSGTPTPPSR